MKYIFLALLLTASSTPAFSLSQAIPAGPVPNTLQQQYKNLKADLDATRYAEGLVSECENWEGNVIFEIRGFHTASGNPATISFNHSTDFDYSEMDV